VLQRRFQKMAKRGIIVGHEDAALGCLHGVELSAQ
jgi:hypothetical protein